MNTTGPNLSQSCIFKTELYKNRSYHGFNSVFHSFSIFFMRSVKSTKLANFQQTREECVIDSKLRENYNKC